MSEEEPQFETLPQPLIDALREQDAAAPPVPEAVDREVLDQAAAHFGQAADSPSEQPEVPAVIGRIGWMKWGGAVAAALVVGVLTFMAIDHVRQQTDQMVADIKDAAKQPLSLNPGSPLELAWDVDRSGRLDVLDLLILAQRDARGDRGVTPEIIEDLTTRIVALDRAAAELPGRGKRALLAVAGWETGDPELTAHDLAGGRAG